MGFKAKEDFIVDLAPDGLSASIRTWLSGQTQPTPAAIVAFDLSAGAMATRAAQAEKAAATASIDNGQLINGVRLERLIRALALVTLDEVNLIRANFTTPMSPRTAAQLVTAIKAKIALTAE
jgi:hypothetical protein